MIEMAEQSTKQIDSLLDFRRPDLAYLEYIVASELVFNRIPNCRDAPLVREDRGTRYQRHRSLVKVRVVLPWDTIARVTHSWHF